MNHFLRLLNLHVKSSKSDYNENGMFCKITAKQVLRCNSRHCCLWVPHRHATMDSRNPTSPPPEQTGPHVTPCQKTFVSLRGRVNVVTELHRKCCYCPLLPAIVFLSQTEANWMGASAHSHVVCQNGGRNAMQ